MARETAVTALTIAILGLLPKTDIAESSGTSRDGWP